MRLERVQVQAFIPRSELQTLAQKKLHQVKNISIRFEDGGLALRGSFRNIPFEVRESVQFHPTQHALTFRLSGFRVGGVPLPVLPMVLSPFTDRKLSLTPSSELPFFIDLHSVEWAANGLRIR